MDDLDIKLAEARTVAQGLWNIVREFPCGLDEIDPELDKYIEENGCDWLYG